MPSGKQPIREELITVADYPAFDPANRRRPRRAPPGLDLR
jgi:hypothetical protein